MVNEFINVVSTYNFMGRAVITATLVGIMAGTIGTFIILRGMALMGDAIAHSVIPGVAISQLIGISHIIGASAVGLLASFLIGFISEKTNLKKDAIIGIVFSSFFALGVVLISRIRSVTDLHNILFGNVLTVNTNDVWMIFIILIMLLLYIALFYKELLLTSFDETLAKVYGYKIKIIQYSFLSILTLVIVSSLQVVGAILIVAMLITPASIGYLLTNRLPIMLFISATVGAFSSIIGLFFSFSFNLPSGSSIVLTLAIIFVLVLIFSPRKGLIIQFKRTH